ncbi:Tat pathway signal sequence domain protein [Paenibacillus sp. FSL H7-0326]|uniref:PKD domain-containing protein n=1 Tax=Paenibacillus sp. FSL H7-0326 TaxID=1921144 RepID=UPI00096C3785|nr:PKD domain-containing protein [Paenibacillus sp. FSL H7-0326]OMC71449.1 Tat pathway signal sequence domain protein [Paenibacillus sp. FSL H7-0326]
MISSRKIIRKAAAGALAMVMLSSMLMPSIGTSAAEGSTASSNVSTSTLITPNSVDPLYNNPVIDSETDLTTPVPHRKVMGHFEGTDKKFTFYFPAKSKFTGRFYQLVYPLQDENATNVNVSFGADSGAYTVQTNGGGGYRVDAAAAQFSRTVAAKYYGWSGRIYGYIYGGSGGSFQTIGALEGSEGVWDGAVPYITGVPTSIPNNFFIRAFARFVLEKKAQQIADAVRPGGSGNPYAGLNDMEKAVLQEVTKLGVPLRAWEDYNYLLGLHDAEGLLGFLVALRGMDPTYVEDFWNKPGYLGTEQSALGELFRSSKVDYFSTVTQVTRDAHNVATSLSLDQAPAITTPTYWLDYTLLKDDGTAVVGKLSGSFDAKTKVFTIGKGNPENVLSAINTGAKLKIDNRWYLAALSYHRHQVPKAQSYTAWEQFRTADGTPIYPQRAMEIGRLITRSVSGGAAYNGNIHAKVIMVVNLFDMDAYPWNADWYSARVKEALGNRFDDNFRVWYNDNADHISPARTPRLVQYDGILQQALRDVSAWVEKGAAPARSTKYEVVDGQVKVPEKATERQGIQPVVNLTVNSAAKIEVKAGQTVTFIARIQVPQGSGKIVATEWDFTGTGDFKAWKFGAPRQTVNISMKFKYTKPGTYYPAIRVTSQREGDTETAFAQIQNLGRARVVVH